RKYGFHGTSHKYVSQRAAEILGKPIEELRMISCHIGNGASIAAIDGGESVDTSMGFTPLAGVTMGTRSGNIDPAVIASFKEKTGQVAVGVLRARNNQFGSLAIYGTPGARSDSLDDGRADERHRRIPVDVCP